MTAAADRSDLQPFMKALPWLAELEPAALERLSVAAWYPVPAPEIEQKRRDLELALEAHVMAYRRDQPGFADALASLVEPAALTDEQLDLLRSVEQNASDCVFVAFARPLAVRGSLRPRRVTHRRRRNS
ncbi:MAG: hypothetical protein AAFR55_10035 [Pseudomonadota bacterium]